MCFWGQGSSLALSALFRPPSPYFRDPIFVHYLPKPRASPLPGLGVTAHGCWSRVLEKARGSLGRSSFLPHFLEARGPGVFIPRQRWGWAGWGLRLLGDAPAPHSQPPFPGTQAAMCGGGGGRFQIFLSVREVTCQRNLPLHFLAIFLFLSSGAQGSRGETGFSRFLSIFCRNAVTALQGLCECRMLGKFLSHLPSILSAAKICGPPRGAPGVNPLPDL